MKKEAKAIQPQWEYACPFCGNIFSSSSQNGSICTFCGLFTDGSREELLDNKIFLLLEEAHSYISQMKEYDLSNLEALIMAKGDPAYVYGLAMLYIANSDILHSNKKYTLAGFMEENADNEKRAQEHYSKAKMLLYETISMCQKGKEANPELCYVEFLANIRLGRLYEAHKALDELSKSEKRTDIIEYAEALYALEANDKNAIKRLDNLIKNGEEIAYFELARLYAREGKLNKAKNILSMLTSRAVALPKSEILLRKVNEVASNL